MANVAATPIRGQFRLSELREGRRPEDQASYLTAVLDDCDGRRRGMIWPENKVEVGNLQPGAIVQVSGRKRFFGPHEIIDVESMDSLPVDLVQNGAAMLPREHCPPVARKALERLVALNDSLEPPVLRDFLTRVLLDPGIGMPFLRARAASNYHHSCPGGLLMHSTDMLDTAKLLGRAVEPGCPRAADIIQLGYLLHDLGKVDTLGEKGAALLRGAVEHEHQTLVMLGPHLAWLRSKWPEGAKWLTSILSHCALRAWSRPHTAWMGSQIVCLLDRLSTAHNCGGIRAHLPDPRGDIDWENVNEF